MDLGEIFSGKQQAKNKRKCFCNNLCWNIFLAHISCAIVYFKVERLDIGVWKKCTPKT